jgi:hypothetical protein
LIVSRRGRPKEVAAVRRPCGGANDLQHGMRTVHDARYTVAKGPEGRGRAAVRRAM